MLSGVRIVEFEALGTAPFAGAMLAELGAEVTCYSSRGWRAIARAHRAQPIGSWEKINRSGFETKGGSRNCTSALCTGRWCD